jgi:TPR repeat protein
MPKKLVCCISLPPATITSVPIADYAEANEALADVGTEVYYSCCGKSICKGCVDSFRKSDNNEKCPFCNTDRDKTDEETFQEKMKRVEVNDAGAMYVLGSYYDFGEHGLQQDHEKASELYARAAELGYSKAHYNLGIDYQQGGKLKKAKFHYEAAAIAGHEGARYNLGQMELGSGHNERAVKHWMIAASAGDYDAMHNMLVAFNNGVVSRESIDSILTAYNNSCAEMRSEARDACIRII